MERKKIRGDDEVNTGWMKEFPRESERRAFFLRCRIGFFDRSILSDVRFLIEDFNCWRQQGILTELFRFKIPSKTSYTRSLIRAISGTKWTNKAV